MSSVDYSRSHDLFSQAQGLMPGGVNVLVFVSLPGVAPVGAIS